jgi:hypothetical protein
MHEAMDCIRCVCVFVRVRACVCARAFLCLAYALCVFAAYSKLRIAASRVRAHVALCVRAQSKFKPDNGDFAIAFTLVAAAAGGAAPAPTAVGVAGGELPSRDFIAALNGEWARHTLVRTLKRNRTRSESRTRAHIHACKHT